MKTNQEILGLYRERIKLYGSLHGKMRQIQDIYHGKAQIPLPEVERTQMPSIPNLLAQGVDQMAGRIASVTPTVTFAAKDPNKRSEHRRSVTAGRVVSGYWQSDRLMMKMKQRARHMIAYGMSPCVVRWDYKTGRPNWQIRNPMECFPNPDIQTGQVQPKDVIFAYRRSIGWLRNMGYGPAVYALLGDTERPTPDYQMLMLEYIDAEGTQLLLTAHNDSNTYTQMMNLNQNRVAVTLESVPTPGNIPTVTLPMRITLDSMQGQFDNMIGMYYHQAKLMALESIAVEKGIFPDTYLVSRPGEVGRFLDGPHDGRTGMVNVISGGDIREIQSQPGYLTNPTIDRLERAQRVTAGIPAEFGGESGSNIRTGRRGDAVLSAVIDYPVAEAQENFSFALEAENKIAMQMAKSIDGEKERTIFVGIGNTNAAVTYKADQVFQQEEHVVSYPVTGSDINQLVIGMGQRIGLGIMSKETAAQLDPFIENPEVERDRVVAEGLETALLQGLQNQAAQGALPPMVLAKVMDLVRTDKMELAEAFNKVTEDAQKEAEAKAMSEQPESPTPDALMADAAMASMAGPQAPGQAIPGASADQETLGNMLNTLRKGSRSPAAGRR